MIATSKSMFSWRKNERVLHADWWYELRRVQYSTGSELVYIFSSANCSLLALARREMSSHAAALKDEEPVYVTSVIQSSRPWWPWKTGYILLQSSKHRAIQSTSLPAALQTTVHWPLELWNQVLPIGFYHTFGLMVHGKIGVSKWCSMLSTSL